ncbi:MAG: hypothetical protein R2794_11590 [Chitinophagales bacterium]
MSKVKTVKRLAIAAGLAVVFTLSLSSCGHKEGCPNKITEVAGVRIDTNS